MDAPFTEKHFLELYPPTTTGRFGENNVEMELGQALEAEALFCPATPEQRGDELRRIAWLAKAVQAAGNLRPEDANLVPSEQPKGN